MNVVKVEHSDGRIWKPEQITVDLIKASMEGSVIIDLLTEGPCCQTLGLNSLLDRLVDLYGFDKEIYTIRTSNQLSSSGYREIRGSFAELAFTQKKAQSIINFDSTLNKYFGLFVGRSNWLRLALASYINDRFSEKTCMTYHYDPQSDYHTPNFGLEELLNRNWDDIDMVANFLKKLPMRPKKLSYPILWNEQALELDNFYKDIFCDVVCESYFSGRTFFMTEKIMRPIINKRPFLVQGPQWYLRNLRKLGFKTFDTWWDEGYDEDPWDFKYQALKQPIEYIGKQPVQIIQKWYEEMSSTLEHNYKIFLQLNSNKILSTVFYA